MSGLSHKERRNGASPKGIAGRVIVLSRADAEHLEFLVREAHARWTRRATRERVLSVILENVALDVAENIRFRPNGGPS